METILEKSDEVASGLDSAWLAFQRNGDAPRGQERAELSGRTALTFLKRRLGQGKPAEITEVSVDQGFIDYLRENAVLESDAADFPGRPVRVDLPTPDQFGLKTSADIQRFRQATIQGSGRVRKWP